MWYFTWILGTWFAASFAIMLALWQEVDDPSPANQGYAPNPAKAGGPGKP